MQGVVAIPTLPLLRRLEQLLKRRANSAVPGAYRSLFRGAGLTFREVRPYIPGDDPRHIDWNITARTGLTHSRQYDEERERTLWLILDHSASMLPENAAIMAAELATLLAHAALQNGDRVGLIRFRDRIVSQDEPQRGMVALPRLLAKIAEQPSPEAGSTDLRPPLQALAQQSRRAVAIILSDFRATDWATALRRAAQKHDLIGLRIQTPLMEAWPMAGIYRLRDAENGATILWNSRSAATRKAWSEQAARDSQAFLQLVRQAQARAWTIRSDHDPLFALLDCCSQVDSSR